MPGYAFGEPDPQRGMTLAMAPPLSAPPAMLVPKAGFEPARLAALPPQDSVSTRFHHFGMNRCILSQKRPAAGRSQAPGARRRSTDPRRLPGTSPSLGCHTGISRCAVGGTPDEARDSFCRRRGSGRAFAARVRPGGDRGAMAAHHGRQAGREGRRTGPIFVRRGSGSYSRSGAEGVGVGRDGSGSLEARSGNRGGEGRFASPGGGVVAAPQPETRSRSPSSNEGRRAIAAPFFCSARRSS